MVISGLHAKRLMLEAWMTHLSNILSRTRSEPRDLWTQGQMVPLWLPLSLRTPVITISQIPKLIIMGGLVLKNFLISVLPEMNISVLSLHILELAKLSTHAISLLSCHRFHQSEEVALSKRGTLTMLALGHLPHDHNCEHSLFPLK